MTQTGGAVLTVDAGDWGVPRFDTVHKISHVVFRCETTSTLGLVGKIVVGVKLVVFGRQWIVLELIDGHTEDASIVDEYPSFVSFKHDAIASLAVVDNHIDTAGVG